jgi:thioredoxin-like negative regulator of GroEL
MENPTLIEIQNIISSTEAAIVYFYTNQCAPCAELRLKVQSLLKEKFPLMKSVYIAADQSTELTSHYNVFASPIIILFFDGKETRRFSKFVSIGEVEQSIQRYYSLIFD